MMTMTMTRKKRRKKKKTRSRKEGTGRGRVKTKNERRQKYFEQLEEKKKTVMKHEEKIRENTSWKGKRQKSWKRQQ